MADKSRYRVEYVDAVGGWRKVNDNDFTDSQYAFGFYDALRCEAPQVKLRISHVTDYNIHTVEETQGSLSQTHKIKAKQQDCIVTCPRCGETFSNVR